MPEIARGVVAAALLAVACGCAGASPRNTPEADPEPGRARAALASLSVENRTAQPLTILYRLTTRPEAATGIGLAVPLGISGMAPVPAGEPIMLIARTQAGAELAVPPRTLPLDGHWTWVIPADARFTESR
ncbi:MAG: hypothetical protein WEF86_13705 [Gemmatimonadota bacterium]